MPNLVFTKVVCFSFVIACLLSPTGELHQMGQEREDVSAVRGCVGVDIAPAGYSIHFIFVPSASVTDVAHDGSGAVRKNDDSANVFAEGEAQRGARGKARTAIRIEKMNKGAGFFCHLVNLREREFRDKLSTRQAPAGAGAQPIQQAAHLDLFPSRDRLLGDPQNAALGKAD